MTRQMTEHPHAVPLPRWLMHSCRAMALAGGGVLLAVMAMVCFSVARRALTGAPVTGDFELVEAGTAIAVFCFLPWCQATAGNVLVDFVTARLPDRATHLLDAAGDALWLGASALIGWRLWLGAGDFLAYWEQSMVLRLPLWWGFTVILPAMALLCLTCLFTMTAHLRKAAA